MRRWSINMKYILFDLDGTITEPKEGITKGMRYALNYLGIKDVSLESLEKYIGPPLSETFEIGFGFDKKKTDEAIKKYREYFSEIGIFENALYDGVKEMFSELKQDGKVLIIATSKPQVFAKRIVEHFDVDKYLTFVAGSELDGSRNSKAEVIDYALKKNNITDINDVIMVGDRKHDIIGAKKNNMKSIGVTFGYGSREELKEAGADYIVDNINELKEMLLKDE